MDLSKINPGDVLFIGFLVLVAIAVIYFAFFYRKDDKRRNSYKAKQQKSGGNADNDAIGALNDIQQIKEPTAEDNYNAGRIEELNILEGNIANARNNRELLNDIVNRYVRAVDDINGDVIGDGINDIAPEIMVANIGNFAIGGLDFILGEVNAGDDFWAPVIPPFQMIIAGANEAGENLRDARIGQAAATTTNKEDFAKKYLTSTVTHSSDPQNVHDSSVNEDLKSTLRELRGTSSKIPAALVLSEIDGYISNCTAISPQVAVNAREALRIAKLGAFISQYGETENNILKYVWERTELPANADNSDNMKECIIRSLADCISENGTAVCAGGRASRYLESLVLQDFNPKVGVAQRQEEYKNQILGEVAKIIDNEAENAAENDPDEDIKKAGQSYKDPGIEVDEDVAEALRERMRKKVSAHIDTYKEHFKPHQLDDLKKDCLAAII